MIGRTALQRFNNQYVPEPNSSCWIWTGKVSQRGYPNLWDGFHNKTAHRFAYEQFIGPIPAWQPNGPNRIDIDHKCRNRLCVNPQHLEAVSPRDNVLRGIGITANNHRKVKCQNGHEFSRIYKGKRICKICRRDKQRIRRAMKGGRRT